MYQELTLVGNVGSDSELRYTPSGSPVMSFSFATSETYATNGEKKTDTTWWRVSLWGERAVKLTEYITKGKQLLVTGTVKARAYQDKSGNLQASLEVKAQTIRFVGSKNDSAATNGGGNLGGVNVDDSDEMPF